MIKISIIGSGDIAQELFRTLKAFSFEVDIHLTFLCHSQDSLCKIAGMVMDSLHDEKRMTVDLSTDRSAIIDTDICVICAGVAITRAPRANDASINNRDSVFEYNLPIVDEYVKVMLEFCPDALKILVTNPVSRLLKHILSYHIGLRKIVGCGVTNDTLRVRNELRNRGDKDYMNAYIVGEHDIRRQALVYIADNGKEYDASIDPGYLSSETIRKIKEEHNSILLSGALPSIDIKLPVMYFSYFKHRLSHFLYKTHISTAECIMEIIRAYIFEDRIVAVETKDVRGDCVIGIPVKFNKKELEYLSLPNEINQKLNIYKKDYTL